MKIKNKKAIIALITAALAANAALPLSASASSGYSTIDPPRMVPEVFGESTYAERFFSLYDDVMTKGVANGYLSANNPVSGGFNVPYHSVETVMVEAPDYGHETTSEAMSYIVWIAAMRDNLVKKVNDGDIAVTNSSNLGSVGDLAKAWKTMEVMIPKTQTGMMGKDPSASYSDEWNDPTKYPQDMQMDNTGNNPIHKYFQQAYGTGTNSTTGINGLYLMHWLADVDNWYGYGSGNSFTFINTFQRGENESCFETVPHPSIENLEYGGARGLAGVFSTENEISKQWRYTNAPDAEDRAIQAVAAANRWGVGNADVSAKAGIMADYLRNDMFDKYYKKLGCQDKRADTNGGSGLASQHFLRAWYTSWGGAADGMWTWQIGASHIHEFYQNPLAAYVSLNDSAIKDGMKAQDAVKDYEASLWRQIEFYEWLQSNEGPFAGGASNSYGGQYMQYPTGATTFYDMVYTEHPVYADPGSNHWIGNQVWATQRLAELLYLTKTESNPIPGIEQRVEAVITKWVDWAVNEAISFDVSADVGFAIPANLDWTGQPELNWTASTNSTGNNKPANTNLHASIRNYSSDDVGCIASWADTLLYYAKAMGAETPDENGTLAEKALYQAKFMMDQMWKYNRDDIGVATSSANGSLTRIFEEVVHVPTTYSGGVQLPNGQGTLKPGVTFLDIRQKYLEDPMFQGLKADYDSTGTTDNYLLRYHRFWAQGDFLMTLGTFVELYPELRPDPVEDEDPLELNKYSIVIDVGESDTITSNIPGSKFESDDPSIASVDSNGKVTGESGGSTTIKVTTPGGQEAIVTVTVNEIETTTTTEPITTTTPEATTTTPEVTTTNPDVTTTTPDVTTTTITETTPDGFVPTWGDVNVDGEVLMNDILLLCKYLTDQVTLKPQGFINADCAYDGEVDVNDALRILRYLTEFIPYSALGPQ